MAIKLIVNGFFRSGTSIVWQILKASNKDLIVFYEPSHKNLTKILPKYKSNYKYDKGFNMHRMRLWDEYFFNDNFINIIKDYHPNIFNPVPDSYNKLSDYIYQFSILESNVILQTNRWHRFIGNIKKESTPCLHIIRNPIEVYDSLIRYSFSSLSFFKKIIKNLFPIYFYWRLFDINYWLKYYQQNIINIKKPRTPFEQFFIVWVLSNDDAISALDLDEIILYESLISNPEDNLTYFEKNKIEFNYKNLLRLKQYESIYDLYYNKNLQELSVRLNISDQYNRIINVIRRKNEC